MASLEGVLPDAVHNGTKQDLSVALLLQVGPNSCIQAARYIGQVCNQITHTAWTSLLLPAQVYQVNAC